MMGDLLQRLVDRGLVTAKEIERVTGRGTSTVYRWLSGETQPDLNDLRHLMGKLSHSRAREAILGFVVADLPVQVQWLGEEHRAAEQAELDHRQMGHTSLDLSLLANEALAEALQRQRVLVDQDPPDAVLAQRTAALIDRAVRCLVLARSGLDGRPPMRRKARNS